MKLVATDVTVVVLPNTGHWILEERPQETSTQILNSPAGVVPGAVDLCGGDTGVIGGPDRDN